MRHEESEANDTVGAGVLPKPFGRPCYARGALRNTVPEAASFIFPRAPTRACRPR